MLATLRKELCALNAQFYYHFVTIKWDYLPTKSVLEHVERKLIKAVTTQYLTNVFHLPLIAVVQIKNQKQNVKTILHMHLKIY